MAIRLISGRYRGQLQGGEVELRVDVDGRRSMNRVSGDIFSGAGSNRTYVSSFVVDSLTSPPGSSIHEGPARFSAAPRGDRVRVVVPSIPALPQPTFVTLQFVRAEGTTAETIVCDRDSDFLRTIELKEDFEQGINRFSEYRTDLESPLPAPRSLSIVESFRDAGIEMKPAGSPIAVRSAGKSWSNAELHAAMERSLGTLNSPQWKVWLFHARTYEKEGALGMMFDQQGKERQGCAVFYRMIGGDGQVQRRAQLHTCLHEIGHCFNLYHPFTLSPVQPKLPVRRAALSWMNYPWKFPRGEVEYWKEFSFQFDDGELIHLRHGFRNDVIMGGRQFDGNGDLRSPEPPRRSSLRPGADGSALELRLEAPESLKHGEPLWVELRLSSKGSKPRRVHTCLHPREGYVQVVIRRQGAEPVVFEPLFRRCMERRCVWLAPGNPPLYESALLGFGKRGFYLEQPGLYEIQAEYLALDGSRVASNRLTLRVRESLDPVDRAVAELFLGEQQGMLLAFRGSDALADGNAKLDEVIKKYGDHPLAAYARLVQANNLAREFKTVEPTGEVRIRPCDPAGAWECLQPVAGDFVSGRSGINNLTFARTCRRLAEGQVENGDWDGAKATLTQLEGNLLERRRNVEKVPFRDEVLAAIQSQTKAILAKA